MKKAISKAREIIEKIGTPVLPIDVEKISELYGIPVYRENLPKEISGVLYLTDEEENINKAIIVNKENPERRQRFSIAHELGHYILNHPTAIHIDKRFLFRDQYSSHAFDPIEIAANTFAAELLMPAELVRSEYYKYINNASIDDDQIVSDLADIFNVSLSAMNYRLINLDLVI